MHFPQICVLAGPRSAVHSPELADCIQWTRHPFALHDASSSIWACLEVHGSCRKVLLSSCPTAGFKACALKQFSLRIGLRSRWSRGAPSASPCNCILLRGAVDVADTNDDPLATSPWPAEPLPCACAALDALLIAQRRHLRVTETFTWKWGAVLTASDLCHVAVQVHVRARDPVVNREAPVSPCNTTPDAVLHAIGCRLGGVARTRADYRVAWWGHHPRTKSSLYSLTMHACANESWPCVFARPVTVLHTRTRTMLYLGSIYAPWAMP